MEQNKNKTSASQPQLAKQKLFFYFFSFFSDVMFAILK